MLFFSNNRLRTFFFAGCLACIGFLLASCDQDQAPVIIIVSPEVATLAEGALEPSDSAALPTPTLLPQISADLSDGFDGSAGGDALRAATPTPEFSPTPLPTPTATPILPPNELLDAGVRALELEDMGQAISYFQRLIENPDADPALVGLAQYNLGIALVSENRSAEAATLWTDYTTNAAAVDPAVWFRLAEIENDAATAEGYYLTFLQSHPELGPYIYPKLADLNPAKQEEYYLAGLNDVAWYRQTINIRRKLAALYLDQERYAEAVTQFDLIRTAAFTANTKGEMTYRIGETWDIAGDSSAAIESWQFGMNQYPTAYESYLGLAELVDREVPVDSFQRGLVDYHAGVYGPAIDAFNAYIAANPDNYRADTHLFMAKSLEQTGQFDEALAELNRYLALAPDNPDYIGTYYLEKSAMETRSISTSFAVETLTDFIANHPEHPEIPYARWRRSVLADRFLLRPDLAIPFYEEFVRFHPTDENTSAAFLRLGLLHETSGNATAALEAWRGAAQFQDDNGRAGLLWLIRANETVDDSTPALAAVTNNPGNYYSLRVNALRTDQVDIPYQAADLRLDIDAAAEQAETEAWLAEVFGLPSVSGQLSPELAGDGRLIRGRNLWRIGERDAAKWELEALRQSYTDDPIASYQIAIEFSEIGLYRSSILAAHNVLVLAGKSVYDAPVGIGRLNYPIHYADMILPLSDEYDYDPLLHFSLIRQESLFEGFATSSAYAQGLSQIIPDTGDFVAQRLNWSDYKNADLYKPHISLIFGAYYFDQQLALFDEFYPAALAAYNGGPGNAIRWYEEAADDPDLYLETINFSETRLYLRTIYSNYQRYRYLYGPES